MTGRPTIFSEDLADEFCRRIASGRSVLAVCGDLDMPSDTTIWRWRHEKQAFRDKLTQARDEKQEAYADRIDALARRVLEEPDLDHQRVRVAIDGIDKAARLQAPKTRVEVSGPNGGPIETKERSPRELAMALLELIRQGNEPEKA